MTTVGRRIDQTQLAVLRVPPTGRDSIRGTDSRKPPDSASRSAARDSTSINMRLTHHLRLQARADGRITCRPADLPTFRSSTLNWRQATKIALTPRGHSALLAYVTTTPIRRPGSKGGQLQRLVGGQLAGSLKIVFGDEDLAPAAEGRAPEDPSRRDVGVAVDAVDALAAKETTKSLGRAFVRNDGQPHPLHIFIFTLSAGEWVSC